MADKKKRPSEISQEAVLAGVHVCADPSSRPWRFRVFPLGIADRFLALLHPTMVLSESDTEMKIAWCRFLCATLMCVDPVPLWIKLRRMIGLSDYSARWVVKNVPFRYIEFFRNEACKAAMDVDFSGYLERQVEAIKSKKKVAKPDGPS